MWDFLIALDKRLAGLMGFSGERTISAECATAPCGFCRMMRTFWLQHCEQASRAHDESLRKPDYPAQR